MTLSLLEMPSSQQAEAIMNGQIDVGFVRRAHGASLDLRLLIQEPVVAALPLEHPLASHPEISLKDLESEMLVDYVQPHHPEARYVSGNPVRGEVDQRMIRTLSSLGVRPRVAQEASSVVTALGLVSVGMGIATVPASVVGQLNFARVVFRPIVPSSFFTLDLYVATRESDISPAANAFRETAIEQTHFLRRTY